MCANGWAVIWLLLDRIGGGLLTDVLYWGGEAIKGGSCMHLIKKPCEALSSLAQRGRLVANLDVGLTHLRRHEVLAPAPTAEAKGQPPPEVAPRIPRGRSLQQSSSRQTWRPGASPASGRRKWPKWEDHWPHTSPPQVGRARGDTTRSSSRRSLAVLGRSRPNDRCRHDATRLGDAHPAAQLVEPRQSSGNNQGGGRWCPALASPLPWSSSATSGRGGGAWHGSTMGMRTTKVRRSYYLFYNFLFLTCRITPPWVSLLTPSLSSNNSSI